MSYNKFTLEKVRQDFKLNTLSWKNPTEGVVPIQPSQKLQEDINEGIEMTATASEKGKSEFVVAPILKAIRLMLDRQISVFSGKNFDIDPKRGLNGNFDFLIARSPNQFVIESPVLALVEAKKDDYELGIGQCAAEMIAAQIFNQRQGNSIDTIYGIVTIGTGWKFLKLTGQDLFIQTDDVAIKQLDVILGMFKKMLSPLPKDAGTATI